MTVYSPARQFMSTTTGVKPIGFVLFNGFSLSELAGLVDTFKSANALAVADGERPAPYKIIILSVAGDQVASETPVPVSVRTECLDAFPRPAAFRALFVMSGTEVKPAAHDPRLSEWLAHTDPASEPSLTRPQARQRTESANLHPHRLRPAPPIPVLRAGRGSGLGAARDLVGAALRLIEADRGEWFVKRVTGSDDTVFNARGAMSGFSVTVRGSSERIEASIRWLQDNGDKPVAIRDAARVAAMSERNFLRRFKSETGLTPSEYLMHLRIDASRRLLIETDLPLDKIARVCGVGNGGRLSRIFRDRLGITPSEYRRTESSTRIDRSV
jgi:transcriptional regulator GlxA family with amidase domain